ncbi:hypothetical protein [Streptomyces sp. NPDC046862]|uniref:DUF7919 family protein n=1 Tax=Streptomyces sp. NPDC046862 TaxID=3154603 RepID=UPI003456EBEC
MEGFPERLEKGAERVAVLSLGEHDCELCPADSRFAGNGEYRFYVPDGAVYAAPQMIFHYMRDHGYRPPVEFQRGLLDESPLTWDWRAERLSGALLDVSADIDHRFGAVVDLAWWKCPESLEALELAALDDVLVDVGAEDVGWSLGEVLRERPDLGLGVPREELPPDVLAGMDTVLGGRTG